VQSNPQPWIAALRRSHDSLRARVEPLTGDKLGQPSYASEWSIAQVLSHLGSGAEITGMFVEAGLSGAEPPGREAFPPIWQRWNEKAPTAQASDALASDDALVARLESLDDRELASLRVPLLGMDMDVVGLTRMRLGEHAVHSWDIAVALDPDATVAADAVGLLIDALGQVAARAGKPAGRQLTASVVTTAPDRSFTLDVGEAVSLEPAGPTAAGEEPGQARLRLPAEALLRLVYGRLDPAHTPPVEVAGVDLDELREIFPGF
jgi:uncharacterized protein (TIGR03083 family)